MQIHHTYNTSRTSIQAVARVAGLAVSTTLFAGVATAQVDVRIPAPLPHFEVDSKVEHWSAPLKDGLAPSSLAHLSLEERTAHDRALDELARGRRTPVAGGDVAAKPEDGLDLNQMRSGIDARTVHQVERSSDGTVWAIGGTYKARFGADGASYVPFLGSSAPRSFPVTFRTTEVRLGGEELGFDHTTPAQLDGGSAFYARGAFVERYDTRVGSLEQLYVFDELPGEGDLVVRIAVESELVGSATADGLAWANELGGVTYSSAVAIDADGRRVAAPTSFVDGFVELRVPASFVASAELPLTIDPVLATYTPSGSPTMDDLDPDIAYDNDNARFCIIWSRAFSANDHDVWAEMFDVFGLPIAGTGAYIDFTTLYWGQAKIANNRAESQFLVVATRNDLTTTDIWGRTREAESTLMGPQFHISEGLGSKNSPDVGGDPHPLAPSFYCVVWERAFVLGIDHDVHARLVTTGSTLHGNSTILIDNSGSTYDKYPTVSKSNGVAPGITQEWNVSWQRQFTPADWDIRGAQVHWDGTITHASFSVDFSGFNDFAPKPSSPLDPTNGARTYMIVYQRQNGSSWDINASALRGDVRFSENNLSALWVAGANQDEFAPVVDTNGIHFSVAYHRRFGTSLTDFDVYVAGVYLVGDVMRISEGPLNLAASSSFEGFVELCTRRSGGTQSDYAGIVWVDSGTEHNIEGATYNMPDHFGQIGANYCTANTNSTGSTGALLVTGSGFVTRNELHLAASQLPTNATLFFLTSRTQGFVTNPGGSQGNLCLGGSIGRFVGPGQILNTGGNGAASLFIDLTQQPTPTGLVQVLPGETWNFQGWHRDTNGGSSTSNLTNGSSVTFL
jgi:hypothetical protein